MADLAVGLAKLAVEGTVSKVVSAIKEEAELKERVWHDLVFITDEFEMMRSFLNGVDREQVKNVVVRTWVIQVRDLAYDVEDCIEFLVHLDSKPAWWHRLFPSCMAAVLPSFLAPAPLPLDEAVADLKQLKARVEDVSQRNMRYNLIADSSMPAVVTEQKQLAAATGAAAFDLLVEAKANASKERGRGDLTTLITKGGSELGVITLWGTDGELGIVSTIRKAYVDSEICRRFECRGWVKLVHPFNIHSILHSLLTQFNANSGQEQGTTMVDQWQEQGLGFLVDEFKRQVNEKRYLIVLQDLSTMVEWDSIRTHLPDMANWSRIIISTHNFEIASVCTGQPYLIWELKNLSVNHSVCVLFNQALIFEEEVVGSKKGADHGEVMHVRGIRDILKFSNLLFNSGHKVVSVWGIWGVGKSDFVRYWKAWKANEIHQDFERFGWVNVTRPFDLRDFSRSLLSNLCPEFHRQTDENADSLGISGIRDPVDECRKALHGHRCLVVIDGLHSTEEWDLIKDNLANGDFSSSIVVTTNEANVARYCAVPSNAVLKLNCLEADQALDLFKQVVQGKNPTINGELTKRLILKCGGLTKVIVAVARSLVSKRNTRGWDQTVQCMNSQFMEELETNPELDSLRGLFVWMRSYLFYTCPDFLRPCILYLASIFPGNHSVRRRRLVMRWVAEGYSKDSHDDTSEDNGEKFFSKLVELDMVKNPPESVTTAYAETRMVLCQVNAFLHEYVISRPLEDNITLALEVFTLKGRCQPTVQRRGRHLVIEESWDRNMIVFGCIDFSRLRSLTVFGKWESFFVSDSMKLLRVLDLEDASDVKNDDLENMMKVLRRLKFLSLRGCREISRLPNSLGNLRQLQTLDVRHTSIVTLPRAIKKLQKLQYLRAGTAGSQWTPSRDGPRTSTAVVPVPWPWFRRHPTAAGVKVPAGIKKVKTLNTLGVFNASDLCGKAILEDLKELTQLRKLGVSGINRRNSEKFCSVISVLKYLESLSVWLSEDNKQGCLDGISQPPEKLQSLKLYYSHVDKLPACINQLGNLRKLDLEMIMPKKEDMHILGDLQLCILRLCVNPSQDGEQLHFSVRPKDTRNKRPMGLGFNSLEVLEIACNSRLSLVQFGPRVMPCLEPLKVRCYGVQPSISFSGLNYLNKLKEISLEGTYDYLVVEDVRTQIRKWPKEACSEAGGTTFVLTAPLLPFVCFTYSIIDSHPIISLKRLDVCL